MSRVTNLILSIGYDDAEEGKIREVNRYFEEPEFAPRPCRGLVSIHDSPLGAGWYGGSKAFEAKIYLGAFNFLQLDDFIKHLRSVQWQSPEDLQVIVKEQDDDGFRVINVFPSS